MKILYAILLFMICVGNVFGQNRANIWQLGFQYFPNLFPQCGISFNSGVADTFTLFRKMVFSVTDASICDTTGQLLFYTNGVWVANRNNDSLKNTSNFNPGYFTTIDGDQGLSFSQGAIAIPEPGKINKYWLFYITAELVTAYGTTQAQPTHLSCSEINMNLDNGLGGITLNRKNIHVIEDTLTQGRITACKHANGRDWWLITHKYFSSQYYEILVAPDTMIIDTQSIGSKFTSDDINGMAVFSPDGTRYAHLNNNDTVDLLQFNRCTGEFSNPQYLSIPIDPHLRGSDGCSFSTNGRFLYVSSYLKLYQFDTWANDINNSKILIDTVPWHQSIDWFFIYQLAPDNKIYIATYNTDCPNPRLHYIDDPDSLGKSCSFKFDGFILPDSICSLTVPNFPNYDLGPLNGSGCDTIVTSAPVSQHLPPEYKVSPNPARDWLNIVYNSNDDAMFELYDLYGRKVAALSLFHYFKNRLLNVGNLTDGMYEWRVQRSGEILSSGKVAVMK